MSRARRRTSRSTNLGLLFAGCALVACGQRASPVEPSRSEHSTGPRILVLAVGQSAAVGQSSQVTFEGVVSDSRCPTGLTCPAAGEVILAMSLQFDSTTEGFILSGRSGSYVQRFLFELLSVEPYPVAGSPIEVAAYRASIRVSQPLF